MDNLIAPFYPKEKQNMRFCSTESITSICTKVKKSLEGLHDR